MEEDKKADVDFDLVLWLKQNSPMGFCEERPDPPPCGSQETLITGSGQVC